MRLVIALAIGAAALGCWTPASPVAASADGRLSARPRASTTTPPTIAIQPGEHRLGLNAGRDGTLYVPQSVASKPSVPLLVMLHGAGGSARSASLNFTFPLAEELGIAVLVPESRGSTWDAVGGGGFGPDVAFIDAALRYTFQRVAVNPARLAIGGFSDGASYALSLGIPNGDLFTHLIAFSPGSITPAPQIGRPLIFLSHGTQDQVLPIDVTSRRIVPRLKSAGYTVTFREFDGPHAVPERVAREAFEWLIR